MYRYSLFMVVSTTGKNHDLFTKVCIFSNMGDRIIFVLGHHHLKRFAVSINDIYFPSLSLVFWDFEMTMCILVTKSPDIMLKPLK
jgi:hypothetical protein